MFRHCKLSILSAVSLQTGSSNKDDQIFYGYIPHIRQKPKKKVYDIEFMYDYFGNRINPIFPSLTYKNAPLNHKFNLWKQDHVVQVWSKFKFKFKKFQAGLFLDTFDSFED